MPSPSQFSVQEQLGLLTRGTVQINLLDDLKKRIAKSVETGTPLRIKAGYDPTAPDLHLGHIVTLRKLRQFQQLGHTAIFLIGDFTAMIGDPTGKKASRPALSREQVLENAETYKRQVFKVLDPDLTEVRFNSEWMDAMTGADLIRLAARYNLARLMERDDFRKRYQGNQPIAVHELLYPLVQGYDSVALKADVELGGTDQIFNLLVGRELQRQVKQPQQTVMTVPLLVGTDAKLEDGEFVGDKMSKSTGNYIGIDEPPNEMYGKVMALSDDLMWHYAELLSERSNDELEALKGKPLEAKKALGREFVTLFHSAQAAEAASDAFHRRFANKELPDEIPEVSATPPADRPYQIPNALVDAGLVKSTNVGRQVVKAGAVKIDGEKCTDLRRVLEPGRYLLQKGKRGIAYLTVEG